MDNFYHDQTSFSLNTPEKFSKSNNVFNTYTKDFFFLGLKLAILNLGPTKEALSDQIQLNW